MAVSETIVPSGGLVLVTGVNGFIASHIANVLLKLGYAVRGTVRSTEKAAWVKEAFAERHPSAKFETVLVHDTNAEGAWGEALLGVQGIVHVAGDMTFGADPNQVITPMINAVRNLLQAAAKERSVKRFVLTSSNRAALNPIPMKEVTVHSGLWNESAIEGAWRPPPYEGDRIWDVYAALKAQVEQEIWRFAKEEKPKFVVNSVLPDFVVGPIFHPKQPGSTGKWVMDFWRDPGHYEPLKNFIPQWFVDVEDTALLHIAGLTQEDVQNERLWGFANTFNFNSWLGVFRKLDPKQPWPADDPNQEHDLSKIDTSRELELLKRFGQDGWTSFYDSVRRNCLETPAAWPA
jgi:nucleoside-diphosphate-sugar epimerase